MALTAWHKAKASDFRHKHSINKTLPLIKKIKKNIEQEQERAKEDIKQKQKHLHVTFLPAKVQ